MAEINRLNGDTGWLDLGFVERERTLELIIEVGIRLRLADISL